MDDRNLIPEPPAAPDSAHTHFLAYQISELKTFLREQFTGVNGRLDKLENQQTDIRTWQAATEQRIKTLEEAHRAQEAADRAARVAAENEAGANSDRWMKVTLAAMALVTTALGLYAATGGTP